MIAHKKEFSLKFIGSFIELRAISNINSTNTNIHFKCYVPASILRLFRIFSPFYLHYLLLLRVRYYDDTHLQRRKLRLSIQILWARAQN